jgi:beta-glucanase (GH16 family)
MGNLSALSLPLFVSASLVALTPALHAQALPPEARSMKLVFAEECSDADFAPNWSIENGAPDARPYMLSSRWRENIDADSGNCRLKQRMETRNDKPFTSGHMWTKKLFTYGYYEARIRYSQASGIDNAFWLMAADARRPGQITCEIDVLEGTYPNVAMANLHVTDDNGQRAKPTRGPETSDYTDGFHTFAVLWTEDLIRWYWDGKVVREERNHPCHAPLAVRLSTAVIRDYWGPVTRRIDGTSMDVDYVRVYQ